MSEDAYAEALRDDMRQLGRDHWDPRQMAIEVASLIACPIVTFQSDSTDSVDRERVVAVLFADSTKIDAFDDMRVAHLVEACRGFCHYLESVGSGADKELVSVRAQATSYNDPQTEEAKAVLAQLQTVTPLDVERPQIGLAHLNLEWRQ